MRAAGLRPHLSLPGSCGRRCVPGRRRPPRRQTRRPGRRECPPRTSWSNGRSVPSACGAAGSSRAAGSDLFDFLHERLTIDKADFRGPAIAVDFARAVTPRIDAVVGFEYRPHLDGVQDRHLVDNDFLPIEQTTTLSTFHLIGEVRYALSPAVTR